MRITEIKLTPWRHRKGQTNQTKSKVYMWTKDETILENLENRHNRPTQVYREVLPQIKEHLCANFHMDPRATLRWNQKAGCSCGCSPGFVVKGAVYNENWAACDVHVTVVE